LESKNTFAQGQGSKSKITSLTLPPGGWILLAFLYHRRLVDVFEKGYQDKQANRAKKSSQQEPVKTAPSLALCDSCRDRGNNEPAYEQISA